VESKKFDSDYKRKNKAKNREIDKLIGDMYRQDQNGGVSYSEFKKMMKGSRVKPIQVV